MSDDVAQKVEAFFNQYRLRSHDKGQVLILNDDTSDYVYHLVEGRVKQYDVSYRGDQVVLNVFKPPAFFPMSLAITNSPSPYIFEAETDIQFHQVPKAEAIAFVKENPDVLFDLLSRVYSGIDGLLGRLDQLMTGSAKSRLMYEVLITCRRFGTMLPDGGCKVQINETELAARAGLSRETVSREMNKMVKQKLLNFKSGSVTVPNLANFEEKLGNAI